MTQKIALCTHTSVKLRFKMTDSENPQDNAQDNEDYEIMSPCEYIMTIVFAICIVLIFFLLLYGLLPPSFEEKNLLI